MKMQIGKRALLSMLLVGVAGCSGAAGPNSLQTVDVFMEAVAVGAVSSPSAGGGLSVSSVQAVLGQASLGNGQQFGCQDCQDQFEGANIAPRLVSLPFEAGGIRVASERVGAGTYAQVEIEVTVLHTGATVGGVAWPTNGTLGVFGSIDGEAFQVVITTTGVFKERLPAPIQVREGASPAEISVTLSISPLSWFDEAGRTLDPRVPGDLSLIKTKMSMTINSSEPESTHTESEPAKEG